MINLSKFRWPYREDKMFSILAFLVLIVPLVFSSKTYENYEMIKFALWLVLLGSAVVLYWLRKEGKPEEILGGSQGSPNNVWTIRGNRPFFWLVGSFLLWGLLSTLNSVDKLNSTFGFYYRFTSGFLFYVSWLIFLILLLKALTRDRLTFLAKVLVFSGLFVAVVGFLQSIGIGYYESLSDPGFVRAPSLLGNPNFSTMFLAGILPLAIALIFISKNFAGKIYFSLSAFFILLANMVLASRGAVLGILASFFLAISLMLRYKFKVKHLKLAALGITLALSLGIAFIGISRPEFLASTLNVSAGNVLLRFTDWKVAAYGIMHHPLLGVGPGNYQIFFEQYRQRFLDGNIMIFDDAHNLFLQMGVTTGLLFVLSFIGLIVLSFWQGLKQLRQNPDPLVLALLTSITALLTAGCFNPFTVPNFILLAVLMSGVLYPATREYQIKLQKMTKPLGVAAGALIAIFGASLVTSEYLFNYGYNAYFQGNYHLAYVLSRNARLINPTNHLYYIYQIASEINLGGSPDKIISQINQVKNIHPVQARSQLIAANLYYTLFWQKGDPKYLEDAVTYAQESKKMDPMSAAPYQHLGLYYFQLGDLDKSRDNLLQGLQIQSGHLPSRMVLARIYQLKGRREEMVLALEGAYKLRPDYPELRNLVQIAKTEPDPAKVPIRLSVQEGVLE